MDGDPVSNVEVPFDDKTADNAVLLLAAAEELGLGPEVVRTSEGAFVVPEEVRDKAFAPSESSEPEPESSVTEPPPVKKPAKKAPAKKAAKK